MSVFSIDITEKRSFTLIAIRGELADDTLLTVRRAVELARGNGYLHIVFDLNAMKSINRAGADFISYVHTQLLALGGGVHVIAESERFGFIRGEGSGPQQIPVLRSAEEAEAKIPRAPRCFEREGFMLIRLPDAFNAVGIIAVRLVVEKIMLAGHQQLVFDLGRCESIDSNALGLMMNVQKKLTPAGGMVAIAGANGAVMQTLETAGVAAMIPCYRSVNAIKW
jgi:anti-anti-sigma factor